jgi:hypothetical protein
MEFSHKEAQKAQNQQNLFELFVLFVAKTLLRQSGHAVEELRTSVVTELRAV